MSSGVSPPVIKTQADSPLLLQVYVNEYDEDTNLVESVVVCADGFTNTHGHTACLKMGEK